MKHKLKINPAENNLVFGDCKYWLPFIPDNSIDLIYIDPPFFSNTTYERIWGNGFERRCFEDRFKGITHYAGWMRERLIIAKDKLKNTGSIFVHCDYRANYKLREVLNELFSEKNFRNEIICLGDLAKRPPERYLQIDNQTIFWFSKSDKFKSIKEGMRKKTKLSFKEVKERYKKYKTGKWGYDLPKGDYCEKTLKEKEKNGLAFKNSKGNWRVIKPLIKKEDHFIRDDKLGNIWSDLPRLDHLKNEKIGYRTQKTESLINRIINIATNKGDQVLDFFGGGGTTAKVAHDLKRTYITGDVSPVAYRVMIDRLKEAGSKFNKINPPLTRTEWLNINDKEFEKKICMFQGWTHNTTSKPVDGWTDKTKRIPVEIKNHSGQTGVGDIRQLAGAMAMAGQKEGVFVAWHYSKGCFEYVAQLEKKEKKKIDLVFAHTIIGELVLTKSQREEYQALYGERVKASKQRVRVIGKAV